MISPFVRIAATKARSAAEREALDCIVSLAERLDELELGFETRINASKARRGEGPTKVSSARREQLQQLAADEKQLEAEQLVQFQAMERAVDILAALHSGMESDVGFWKGAHHHTNPAEKPVVQELVDAKIALLEAMATYLSQFRSIDG